jgi:hypothetical protein
VTAPAEPPMARYSDPLAPLGLHLGEYSRPPLMPYSWCDWCDEKTPTDRCLECDATRCAQCERCHECQARDYDEDYEDDPL